MNEFLYLQLTYRWSCSYNSIGGEDEISTLHSNPSCYKGVMGLPKSFVSKEYS